MATRNSAINRQPATSRTAATGRGTVGGNLIYNGDFEISPAVNVAQTSTNYMDGTSGGNATNNTYTWALRVVSGSGSALFDSSTFHSGTKSLKLSTTASGSRVFAYHAADISPSAGAPQILNANARYVILADPGKTYKCTFWMKTTANSGSATTGARMEIQNKFRTGTTAETFTSTAVTTTTPWTQYSFTFTPSLGLYMTVVPVIVGQDGTGTLQMDAWFDDIVITPFPNTTRNLA